MWGRAGPGSAWTGPGNTRQAEPAPHPDFRSDTTPNHSQRYSVKFNQYQQKLVLNPTWPISLMQDAIIDSLWKQEQKGCFVISDVTVCQVWTFVSVSTSGKKILEAKCLKSRKGIAPTFSIRSAFSVCRSTKPVGDSWQFIFNSDYTLPGQKKGHHLDLTEQIVKSLPLDSYCSD